MIFNYLIFYRDEKVEKVALILGKVYFLIVIVGVIRENIGG